MQPCFFGHIIMHTQLVIAVAASRAACTLGDVQVCVPGNQLRGKVFVHHKQVYTQTCGCVYDITNRYIHRHVDVYMTSQTGIYTDMWMCI